MKFAYADPPYIGQAKRHYSHDPRCAEVDHPRLISDLYSKFPDGWALSCSSPTLREVSQMCHNIGFDRKLPECRVGIWVKTFCAFKRNVRPAYGWEPVIFWGGRNPVNGHRAIIPEKNGKQTTPKDFILAEDCIAESITLKKGLVGAKPPKVCNWILDLLNFQPGDTLIDLYPGTGIMGQIVAARSAERQKEG